MKEFRSAYSGPVRFAFSTNGPSLTRQSFKDECDINLIMRRYENNGILPPVMGSEARFLDCTGEDYQSAMFLISAARSQFMDLPSSLRDRFENDPGRLLEFLNDDSNMDEAIKLGLHPKPGAEPAPVAVRVVAQSDT